MDNSATAAPLKPSEETKKEYEIHGGFSQETISNKYDELSRNYEDVYNSVGWPDPVQCAEQTIANGYTEASEVLDMGCGTGLVAQYLKEKSGVETPKVIGIDASQGMIDKAEKKGVYTEIRKLLLCDPEKYKEEQSDLLNRFDFITASGLLAEGHATCKVFDEMLASLKVGGYAIFTSRIEYLESLNYQEGMDERVKDGQWELVSKTAYEKYSKAKDNPVGRFKPVMSEVFVFKKL
jgi:predicted TPR repeat methyltransferase